MYSNYLNYLLIFIPPVERTGPNLSIYTNKVEISALSGHHVSKERGGFLDTWKLKNNSFLYVRLWLCTNPTFHIFSL